MGRRRGQARRSGIILEGDHSIKTAENTYSGEKTLNLFFARSAGRFLRRSLRKLLSGASIGAAGAALCASSMAQQSSTPLTLADCIRLAESAPNAISVAQ